MRHFVLVCLVLLVSLTTTNVFAGSFPLKVGVGIKGGINGSTVNGVPETEPLEGTNIIDPNIYTMFGFGGAVGLDLEIYVLNMIGLETGFYQSWDNGNGFEDIKSPQGVTQLTINQKQRTSAFHIPLIAKFSIPGELVRPTFGLGVEFVLQNDSTIEHDYDRLPLNVTASPENYTLFVFSFALEFQLGVVRVPLELKGGYNVGFENTVASRTDFSPPNNVTYHSAYVANFGIFTGVIYDFDFLL